jgi:hypothetical protein
MNVFLTIITVLFFVSVLLFAGFYAMVLIENLKEDYIEDYGNYDEQD